MPHVAVERRWAWWRWRFADGRVSRRCYARIDRRGGSVLDDFGRTPLAPPVPLGRIEWVDRQLLMPAESKARLAHLPPVLLPAGFRY